MQLRQASGQVVRYSHFLHGQCFRHFREHSIIALVIISSIFFIRAEQHRMEEKRIGMSEKDIQKKIVEQSGTIAKVLNCGDDIEIKKTPSGVSIKKVRKNKI